MARLIVHTPTTITTRILLAALFIGVIFDYLFFSRPVGVSAPLFVGLLLVAMEGLSRSKGIPFARHYHWLLLPLLLVAGMVAIRANPFLTTLNLLATLSLLALLAHFRTRAGLTALGLPGYGAILARVSVHAVGDTIPLIRANWSVFPRHRSQAAAGSLLRGLLLAAPLLLVFTLLLGSADLIFASTVGRVLNNLLQALWEGISRSFVILAVAWIVAGGLAYALLGDGLTKTPTLDVVGDWLHQVWSLGLTEAAVILGLVDTLFLLFARIQFTNLFAGRSGVLPEGFTYAQYARRGFFELLAASLLALLVILTLEWLTERQTRRGRLIFRLLASLMVSLVMVMLVSAFIRLQLYEQAFGYTRLRLTVHTFMVWLGLLLGWLLVTQWWGTGRVVAAPSSRKQPGRFAIGAFVAALGFLLTLNALNPDAFIVRQNLARHGESGELDASYLASLSDDAVPALTAAVVVLDGDERDILCERLHKRQQQLTDDPRPRQWPGWHLSAHRAYQALLDDEWTSVCPPPLNDERGAP